MWDMLTALDSVPRNLFGELSLLADHYDTEMAPKKDEKKAAGPLRSHVLIQGPLTWRSKSNGSGS